MILKKRVSFWKNPAAADPPRRTALYGEARAYNLQVVACRKKILEKIAELREAIDIRW